MSIKPEFALKIFDGTKKFEFRKSIYKNDSISSVIVYASSPMKKVIGEFKIKDIHKDSPTRIWKQTKNESGITKKFFDEYFQGREKAYAIEIQSINKYKNPKCLKKDYNIHFAPQSFMYVE